MAAVSEDKNENPTRYTDIVRGLSREKFVEVLGVSTRTSREAYFHRHAIKAPPSGRGFVKPGAKNEADMTDFLRNAAGTYFHESCTCKMGTDEMSVVDGSLSVRGVEGLTIADASVMPQVSTGNTMAPTVIIGERAADVLIG